MQWSHFAKAGAGPGTLVLVFGFFVAAAAAFGWYYLMDKIGTAIFG
jgi:hypothetical protein